MPIVPKSPPPQQFGWTALKNTLHDAEAQANTARTPATPVAASTPAPAAAPWDTGGLLGPPTRG